MMVSEAWFNRWLLLFACAVAGSVGVLCLTWLLWEWFPAGFLVFLLLLPIAPFGAVAFLAQWVRAPPKGE